MTSIATPPLRRAPERREMALILGLVFILNFVPGGLLQLTSLRWGLLVTQILFIAGPVVLALRWFYLDGRLVLPFRLPSGETLAGAALGALALNHLLNLAVMWQDRRFPMPEIFRTLFESLSAFDGPVDFLLLLLLLGAVPGVCEEILFRGFLHAGLRHELGSGTKAVLLGGLIFALFHLNPWRFPVLLVIGVYLGFLRERSGSMLPSMLAHALINMQSVALSALPDETQNALIRSPVAHVAAAGCLAAAALLLRPRAAWKDAARVL